jgi:hypothetical protein
MLRSRFRICERGRERGGGGPGERQRGRQNEVGGRGVSGRMGWKEARGKEGGREGERDRQTEGYGGRETEGNTHTDTCWETGS